SGASGRSRNRILLGVALVLAGLATIFGGLIAQVTVVGLAGFLIALTGSVLVYRALTTPGALVPAAAQEKAPRARKKFGDRLQERWDERNFE
ncbi:MAG: DUF3040 domain-containing protein, partial [Candidatus Planktophila sp.]